jgi:hypothetical protein
MQLCSATKTIKEWRNGEIDKRQPLNIDHYADSQRAACSQAAALLEARWFHWVFAPHKQWIRVPREFTRIDSFNKSLLHISSVSCKLTIEHCFPQIIEGICRFGARNQQLAHKMVCVNNQTRKLKPAH